MRMLPNMHKLMCESTFFVPKNRSLRPNPSCKNEQKTQTKYLPSQIILMFIFLQFLYSCVKLSNDKLVFISTV